MVSANLPPASRRQDHTTSPSAVSALVNSAVHVHRIPPRVDDVAQRPSVGQDGGSCRSDVPDGRSEIFLKKRMDRRRSADQVICPSGTVVNRASPKIEIYLRPHP